MSEKQKYIDFVLDKKRMENGSFLGIKKIPYNCSESYGISILLIVSELLDFLKVCILDVILWLLCAACLLTAVET